MVIDTLIIVHVERADWPVHVCELKNKNNTTLTSMG